MTRFLLPLALLLFTRAAYAECTLSIEPSHVRMATASAVDLHAHGGSGRAVFTTEGDAHGAAIEAGGGLRAGDAASFEVVARDDACGGSARAHVDVIGPFDVQPRALRLPIGGHARFDARGAVGDVTFASLDGTRLPAGEITGEREASFPIVARDEGSGREIALTVEVKKTLPPLRPRAAVLAVPAGGRIALAWEGGSGSMEVMAEGSVHLATIDGVTWADAKDASPGTSLVRARDRVTHEEATARVVVGNVLGAPSVVRGTQSGVGSLASGDFNGDGHVDLAVGHAERAKVGLEAGGILVYFADKNGGFASAPTLTLEGEHAGDRFGSVMLARDMNRDGIDDLVVGIPDEDLGESDRGAIAIYLGSKDGLVVPPERVLSGEDAGHHLGGAIAAEDLNGDGAPELVVSAPGAKSPFAKACEGGRVYVYRSRPGMRGVVEAVPWQTIELRDALSDGDVTIVPCSATPLGAGRAIALADVDGDGARDLVVGEPQASYPQAGRGHGAVDVYRGASSGAFSPTPTWSIHLDAGERRDGAGFGSGLDVVDGALVVRAPGIGASWVFPPKSLGAPVAKRVRGVTTHAASARLDGAARFAAMADVDGDGKGDYVALGAGRIALVPASIVSRASGAITPSMWLASDGDRVTALGSGGLAVLALSRSTAVGPFVGAVDVVAPAHAPLASRWGARTSMALSGFGASDRAGSTVALAESHGEMMAFVGAPGAHSSAAGHVGEHLRTGAIDLFAGNTSRGRIAITRDGAQLGSSPMVPLDFDGDGAVDLAVSDPGEPGASAAPGDAADPDRCKGESARGVVRVYSAHDGVWDEKFRVIAPRGEPLANAISAGDVNGDGKDDLVIGRAIVHGRKGEGSVTLACAHGEGMPAATADVPIQYGNAVAVIGDLDRDGCAETAMSISRANVPGNAARAGVAVLFGYDAAGAHCRGHRRPFVLHVVPDDHALDANALGDASARLDDTADRKGAATQMGSVLAQGRGDVTGDGVPDLVFRDGDLATGDRRGPAVEIVSGAYLASLCPNRVCAKGRSGPLWADGEWRVLGLRSVGAPHRRVVMGNAIETKFGSAMSIGDVSGDGVADVAIGVPDGGTDGSAPFAGEVRVYEGSKLEGPWLIAVGDARERSAMGSAVSVGRDRSGAWLLVGAPLSNRNGSGGGVGAAYSWKIDALQKAKR